MKNYEELEYYYEAYDEANNKKEKKRLLEKILELDPDDVDAMHRMVSLLPKGEQLNALLELKEKAVAIVERVSPGIEDFYYDHEAGRPTVRLYFDILDRYERLGRLEEAYGILKEMMAINEGDNLGERFHLVAYLIGQDKLEELSAFVKACPDDYSPALRFASLYLEQRGKNDDFDALFKEFPYLYAFLSKEIPWIKSEMELEVDRIAQYRPGGFFECLLFYRLLQIYATPETKQRLFHLCAIYKGLPKLSIREFFPRSVKTVLYAMLEEYNGSLDALLKRCQDEGMAKPELASTIDLMKKHLLIDVDERSERKSFYFDEATLKVAKMYLDADGERISRLLSYVSF